MLIYQFISVKISDNKFSEGILEVRILSYQLSHTFTLTTYLVFYKYFFLEKYVFLECMHVIHIGEQYGAGNKLYWKSQTRTWCVFKLYTGRIVVTLCLKVTNKGQDHFRIGMILVRDTLVIKEYKIKNENISL